MIKAVFIDIDGTILDFDECVKQTMITGFEKFGLKPYEPWMFDVFTEENDKLWCALEKKELTFEELMKKRWNIIFKRLDIDFDGQIFETYLREELKASGIPTIGAFEMLDELKGKYILCTASNGPYLQQINRQTKAGMLDYFDYQFISEKQGASKPAKEFFIPAFEELNDGREIPIRPDECLMIGDSMTSDMAGARGFGMNTCLYWPSNKPLPKEGYDVCVKSLKEVASTLENNLYPGSEGDI